MSQENAFQMNGPNNNTDTLDAMWRKTELEIATLDTSRVSWWKDQELPLGRVKKIMKEEDLARTQIELQKKMQDGEEVDLDAKHSSNFMIAGEAPVLMTKACEMFIRELATRSWRYANSCRRKTLQRADIYSAVGESDMFDFLIDIVPRANPMMDPSNTLIPPSVSFPTTVTIPQATATMMQTIVQIPQHTMESEPDFTIDDGVVPTPFIEGPMHPPSTSEIQQQLQQHFATYLPGNE